MALESQQRVRNPDSACMPGPHAHQRHGAMSKFVHLFVLAPQVWGVGLF